MSYAGERYRLELRALPGGVPAVLRLRQALKCLLRSYRLRCTSITSPAQPTDIEPSAALDSPTGVARPGVPAMSAPSSRQTDPAAIAAALAAPFDAGEVKFKPAVVSGNRALALAYVDARVIQDRLDDVLGVMGWQDSYKVLPDGSVMCRLRLKIGEQWVTKVDVGGQSEQPDGGDRTKAAFSDALKRAAVKFGVARYLYRLPQLWTDYDPHKRQFVRPPALPASALPAPAKVVQPAAPAKAGNGHQFGLPATGAELQRRLTDYDVRLASQGLCQPGELLRHVAHAGVLAGLSAELTAWGAEGIRLAVEWTKAFEAERRAARKATRAVQPRRLNGAPAPAA